MPPKTDPAYKPAGYNVQIVKETDIAGGREHITMNTHLPPDATEADLYDKIKRMGNALQRRINEQREKERVRQEEDLKQYERMKAGQPALHVHESPVDLPDPPETNGTVTEQ